MPDIDIDFSVRGRDRMIRYVTDKYGKESVAQIVTFGKMFPRAATRDAARVLGHDYGAGDRLAKLIPDPIMGRSPSFKDCLAPGQPLRAEVDRDPIARQIVDVAQGLEGIVRNSSIHAAAVVIADRPLTDIVPLQIADAGTDENGEKVFRTVTQFTMKPVEQLGLLKMDFLGLRNLDVIEDALDIVERSTGDRPDMSTLPLDHAPTYEMLAAGDAIGVFQFESEGMREALKKVRPTEFDDLVALGALYRPGAMDQIPTYARGKRDPETIAYADDRLRPILESTKGVIIYQEQAMQIAKELAGFSGAKADDLRKAIGKKNREAMAKLKPEFVAGCQASGTSGQVIELLWATNERSADYCFNKSHAACYALISYRTAWLKANYPAEYMAALISSVMDTKDRVPFFVSQAEQMGISILPPDVNLSDHEFVVVDGDIRFGLDAVKGVGYPGRGGDQGRAQRGRHRSATCGTSAPASTAAASTRRRSRRSSSAAPSAPRARRARACSRCSRPPRRPGQRPSRTRSSARARSSTSAWTSAAARARAGVRQPQPRPDPDIEFERGELLAAEKEAIGLFISAHPLKEVGAALRAKVDCSLAEVATRRDGDWVTVGGMITQAKKIRTKKGDPMMFATLDDLSAQVEIIVFGKTLATNEADLEQDSIVTVRGRVDHKDKEKVCLIAQQVDRFDPTPEEVEIAEQEAARVVVAPTRAAARARRHRAARQRARRAQGRAGRLPRRRRRGHRAAHDDRAAAAEARARFPGGPQRGPARRARRAARPGDHPREHRHARGRDGQRRGVAAPRTAGGPGVADP